MASIEFKGFDSYEQMLAKLGDNTDAISKSMVSSGLRVLFARVKAANSTFSKYVKMKPARKNQWGWFAQVQFRGKTEQGTHAALAANVYEHGRAGQPARPWLKSTCASAEADCVAEMQRVYDEEVAKIADT